MFILEVLTHSSAVSLLPGLQGIDPNEATKGFMKI